MVHTALSGLILVLPSPPQDWDGLPVILNAPSVFIPRAIEHAGRAYHENVKTANVQGSNNNNNNNNNTVDESPHVVGEKSSSINASDAKYTYENLMKVKDFKDYYALLGLSDLSVSSTEDDIKKSYRIVATATHPDKALTEDRDAAEERFKAMQKAYEALSDPNKRRIYDSSIEFDETIPDDKASHSNPEEFFKVYAPVFLRNERFSIKKPCPRLGDINTKIEDVDSFYDFWLSFRSWRDFSFEDDHKEEEAQSREEKRWMQRENAKKQASLKKEEVARIRRLVENAMKRDPRIIAFKKKLEEEKIKKKLDKQAFLNAKRDEEEKLRLAELAKVEEAKNAEKKIADEKKAVKEKLKLARGAFSKACRGCSLAEDKIERLRGKLDQDQLIQITELFASDSKAAVEQFNSYLVSFDEAEKTQAQRDMEKAAEAKYKKMKEEEESRIEADKNKAWTYEEETQLTRALVKFPIGLKQRWEKITEMVNQVGNKSLKEVMTKAKKNELSGHSVDKDEAFAKYQIKMQKEKEVTEKAKTKNISAEELKKIEEEKQKEEAEKLMAIRLQEQAAIKEAERLAAIQLKEQEKAEREALEKEKAEMEKEKEREKNEEKEKAKAESSTAESSTKSNKKADEWTLDEQALFEKALKNAPKSDDRWDIIAKEVGTKTKKQCITRFKTIREEVIKRKGQAPV